MRTLAYLVVLLVASIAIMFVVGRSLPVTHLASRGERFDAPLDTVWRIVTDVAAYPSWRAEVSRVELLQNVEGRMAWREESRGDAVEYVAEEVTAPERFTVRITSTGLPYGGRWLYELHPDTGGTRLTITEEGEIYNPLFRFLSKYVFGQTSTIEKYLGALGARLAR